MVNPINFFLSFVACGGNFSVSIWYFLLYAARIQCHKLRRTIFYVQNVEKRGQREGGNERNISKQDVRRGKKTCGTDRRRTVEQAKELCLREVRMEEA
jgi:hypothetical protein